MNAVTASYYKVRQRHTVSLSASNNTRQKQFLEARLRSSRKLSTSAIVGNRFVGGTAIEKLTTGDEGAIIINDFELDVKKLSRFSTEASLIEHSLQGKEEKD